MASTEPAEASTSLSGSYNEKNNMIDWEGFRRRSLEPGGFGSSRVDIWPKLLHVSPILKSDEENKLGPLEEHRDERQIHLDTDRSFVLYPVDIPSETREMMQTKLNRLLVSVFRRHPRLHYFQGYHDIISVLLLTLPEEVQFACAEQISLHRVRDSMGATLEPVLGLLRVTKNLLRLADPQYAQDLERASPLPFYALSNLLTLFSHDIPTLPLIQHVFDYILCRPPIIIVYLAIAIILSKKEEIRRLEEQDEEGMGMAHSLLSSLPRISDEEDVHEMENVEKMETEVEVEEAEKEKDVLRDFVKKEQEKVNEEDVAADEMNKAVLQDAVEIIEKEAAALNLKLEDQDAEVGQKLLDEVVAEDQLEGVDAESTAVPAEEILLLEGVKEEPLALAAEFGSSKATPSPSRPASTKPMPSPSRPASSTPAPSRSASSRPTPSQSRPASSRPTPSPSRPVSPPPSDPSHPSHPPQPTLTLTSLLSHADALYALYPPTHSALALSSIMGPQSVVHTWSESRAALPEDDEAEAMIARPELVVYPFIEEDEDVDEAVEGEEAGEWDEKSAPKRKRVKGKMRGKIRGRLGVDRRTGTMVAGAVLVFGVAMAVAVYGGRMRGTHVGAGMYGFPVADGHGKEWRKVAAWVGGAVVGVTERVFSGLGSSSSLPSSSA